LPLYGWSKKGKTFKKIYSPTHENISFLAAIGIDELIACQIFKEGVTRKDFACFLINIIKNNDYIYKNLEEFIFFFDNAKIHSSKIMAKLYECLNIMYNVPYSPALNPIEEYFGLLKYYFRKNQAQKKQHFLPIQIYSSAKQIQRKQNQGFVYNSIKKLELCLKKKDL
jgi:hypothetical protein